MRVLIVEDEEELRLQLHQRLVSAGYAVDVAENGEEGKYIGKEFPIDVAVVDIGLPNMSGIDMVRSLRKLGRDFPILILTAHGRWQDKVEGLEAGADDYLVKPVHMEELEARLKALLRRAAGLAQPTITSGAIALNTHTQEVTLHGELLELTAYEFKVLEYLMLHAGQVISKTVLTEHIYAQDYDRDSNVIEVFVGRLRRKLDPTNQTKPIETLRGRGYRFNMIKA